MVKVFYSYDRTQPKHHEEIDSRVYQPHNINKIYFRFFIILPQCLLFIWIYRVQIALQQYRYNLHTVVNTIYRLRERIKNKCIARFGRGKVTCFCFDLKIAGDTAHSEIGSVNWRHFFKNFISLVSTILKLDFVTNYLRSYHMANKTKFTV